MKRFYGSAAAMMIMAMAATHAMAQKTVLVGDNVLFSSNSVEDPVRTLSFGFGSEYTDSVDFDKGEQILPPFFPPDGFFVYFGIKDKTGGEDFGTKDVRGVPDSVKSGSIDHFSQEYVIRLNRGTGQDVSISFQFPLMYGIDSVNFQSIQAGANFSYTFTDRGQVKIPNNLITSLKMTVYYDYQRALSVPAAAHNDGPASLQLYPNPARSGRSITLSGNTPAGARMEVSDIYGAIIDSRAFGEARENPQVALSPLSAGAYMVRVLDAASDVIGQGRLVVVE